MNGHHTTEDHMAHTPGPWGMPDSGKGLVSKKTPHGWDGMIASADCGDYARSRTEGLANARLIAAAPELLEACKEALKAFESNACIDWSLLSTAILKAEGVKP